MDKLLAKHFPEIDGLFEHQKTVLSFIEKNMKTLSVVPTGGGKSLIFQLASLKQQGTTIVISPLKALMIEQVIELNKRGINAISINSDISFQEQRKLLRTLGIKPPKLLYVSPERLHNQFFRAALLHGIKIIPLVVIDEAHCISQWGIDFRPEYGAIKPFIEFLQDNDYFPTVLALTATLGIQARHDIETEFEIDKTNIEPNVIRTDLKLNFEEVSDDKSKVELIKSFIKTNNLIKVIVYLYSINKCEELSHEFPGSTFFHAALDPAVKLSRMEEFKNSDSSLLFATTAFGMGINIPDVDGIIHHDIPGSVEEYYQHVGRAARDNTKCPIGNCLMLWSEKNFDIKAQDIKRDSIKKEHLIKAMELLGLPYSVDNKVIVDENVFTVNDGKYGRPNMKLIYRIFEKHGICTTIGEIHGKPRSIGFKKPTTAWQEIVGSLKPGRNNYLVAAKKSGYSLQQIINHVYEQELAGNIEKLPATERQLIIEAHYDSLSEEQIDLFLKENAEIQKVKKARLDELMQLCTSSDKQLYIAKVLGVPYSS